MMNFEGLDPGLGEYTPGLHGGLEPGMDSSMDPRLDPALLQGVVLDPDALTVPVSESMLIVEGMYSELHSVAAEVGIPVTATHFDLQEELLWMGNHRVKWHIYCCIYTSSQKFAIIKIFFLWISKKSLMLRMHLIKKNLFWIRTTN